MRIDPAVFIKDSGIFCVHEAHVLYVEIMYNN